MKMGRIEKVLVNSALRSRRVSLQAEARLQRVEFERGQRYLDVGCGNGQAPLHLAREYGLDVTGVDVDPEQIRLATESATGLAHARFVTVDGTALPFADDEFDIVASSMATHHIPLWQDALAEMVRVLRPGGFLIYNDLVYPAWLASLGRSFLGRRGGFPTRGELDRFVERHDLAVRYRHGSPVRYVTICQRPRHP